MNGKMDGKKSNYTRAEETVTAGKSSRSSSLYDSEIINYCFVCRHISFVTVKRRKDLAWSLFKTTLLPGTHVIYL